MTVFRPIVTAVESSLTRIRAVWTLGVGELARVPSTQIAELDVLRSMAILLVISAHFNAAFTESVGPTLYSRLPFVSNGWIGVDLFFVLSGYFIGGQLWKELKRTGGIAIGTFVLRRGLRIWPLYFVTLFVVLVMSIISGTGVGNWWRDAFFLSNYGRKSIVFGGWSLSTEEQFYLITPMLLAVLGRSISRRAFLAGLWGLLFLGPILRSWLWMQHVGSFRGRDLGFFEYSIYRNFHTHYDTLVAGLIISYLLIFDGIKASKRACYLFVLFGFIILIITRAIQPSVLSFTGLAAFFGALVFFGLHVRVWGANARIFYWISRLSFGMYLNHPYLEKTAVSIVQPAITKLHITKTVSEVAGVFLLTLISALVAVVSFVFVEAPFLRWRTSLLQPQREMSQAAVVART